MTAAEIPAPPDGWRMACRCGIPVQLGHGNFESACQLALEHMKSCPVRHYEASVALAISELVLTTMWSLPEFFAQHRDLLTGAAKLAQQLGAPPVRATGGCGSCG